MRRAVLGFRRTPEGLEVPAWFTIPLWLAMLPLVMVFIAVVAWRGNEACGGPLFRRPRNRADVCRKAVL